MTGDRTTMAVMLAFLDAGYPVSVPFGENTRYDLVVEIDGDLRRVQCKTGRLRDGAVVFPTTSSDSHHPNPKPRQRHYRGQVDLFAVYCVETATVYLVPIEGLGIRSAQLRVHASRNGQRSRVRLAETHALSRVEVERIGSGVSGGPAGPPALIYSTRRAPTQLRV